MDRLLEIMMEYKHDPSNTIFLESVFKYYEGHNYSEDSIIEMSEKLSVGFNTIKSYLSTYVTKVLKVDKQVFIDFKNQKRKENKNLYIGRPNLVLKMHNIDTYFLWTTDEEKELFLKEIYEYSTNNNFLEETTIKMCNRLGIDKKRYLELIKLYKTEYLKNKKIEKKEVKKEEKKNELSQADQVRMNNTRLNTAFESIINSSSPEETEKYINESGYQFSNLRDNFDLFKKFYSTEDVRSFYQKMVDFKDFRDKRTKKRLEEQLALAKQERLNKKIDDARTIIESYISTKGIPFSGFLNMHQIDEKYFEKCVKIIKENDKELYDEYLSLKVTKEKDEKNSVREIVKSICDGIRHGVMDNDKKRKFDVIDYFDITNIPIKDFFSEAFTKASRSELMIIKDFIRTNREADKDSNLERSMIFSQNLTVRMEIDKNGKIIEGTGRKITREDNERIVKFLEDNNYPVNRFTHRAILNRYLDDHILLDSSTNTLTRKLVK